MSFPMVTNWDAIPMLIPMHGRRDRTCSNHRSLKTGVHSGAFCPEGTSGPLRFLWAMQRLKPSGSRGGLSFAAALANRHSKQGEYVQITITRILWIDSFKSV